MGTSRLRFGAVEPPSLLPRRATGGPAAFQSNRRRLVRLERAEPPVGCSESDPELEPSPLRRAATIAALVAAPWLLVAGGLAAGLALS
jgi:hypothetical protein